MTSTDNVTKLTPREWLLSILAHAVIFAILFYLIPANEVAAIFAKDADKKPVEKARQDPTQVREVVKSIAQEQAQAAKAHVAQLMDLEQKLNDLTKERLTEYHEQAKTIAVDAAQKTLEQLQQIPPGQDVTAQAQDQLAQQLQKNFPDATSPQVDKDSMKAMRDQLAATQLAITQSQIKTQEAQEKATQLLHFVAQDSPLADAQQKANDAETAAALSQQNTNKLQNQLLDNLGSQVWQQTSVKNATAQVAALQPKIDEAKQAADQAQPALDAAKALLDAATAAADQAKQLAMAEHKPENFKKSDAAHKALEQAQKAYNQVLMDQNRKLNQLKNLQNQQAARQTALNAGEAKLAATQADYAKLQAQLIAAQAASKNDQLAAKQAQQDSITQLAAAAANTAQPLANKPAADEPPETLAPDKISVEGKDLGQLYATARQLESRITDKYKTYRAAEFASIQKLTLPDALKATQVARPDREQLNAELLSAHGAAKQFNAYKAEVTKANQQIQSMVALGSDMVSTAQAQKEVGHGDVKLQQDKYDNMVAAALDDPNAAGKDLTGATGGAVDGGAKGVAEGSGAGAGEAMGADAMAKGKTGGGEPDGIADPNAPHAKEFDRTAPELPAMDYANIKPVATRVISENGPHHADWLYVDSWYLIGPFPNEGRQNLYTKLPPESIVDLDAVYTGKGGRPLHWVYTQWATPKLSPPNDRADAPAIYYAYTELIFDQAQDLWIASGSDDKGTMWLNDVMVWNSNDTLKWWHPNEGYRKVHFKEGRNRILYRLENGQYTAIFSLMISTKQN